MFCQDFPFFFRTEPSFSVYSAIWNLFIISVCLDIILLTYSESKAESVARFPVDRPGNITDLPVTSCIGEKPSLLTLVLWLHPAIATASSNFIFLSSSIIFLMILSALAWFLSLIPFAQGEYAGPNLIDNPFLSQYSAMSEFLNSVPLSLQYPTEGIP